MNVPGRSSALTDRVGLCFVLIALILVLLPPSLDPAIRWKERLEGWPKRPRERISQTIEIIAIMLFCIVMMALFAIPCLIEAALIDWRARRARRRPPYNP
jgi:hypothetical protein